MSDRMSCTLKIVGKVQHHQFERITELVKSFGFDEEIDEGEWSFHEVRYGTLDPDIEAYLQDNEIGYIWTNEAKYEYPAGVQFFDPTRKEEDRWADFITDSANGIVLSLATDITPERIEWAKSWQWFWDHAKLELAGDPPTKPKRYSHAFTLAFELVSHDEDGEDVTPQMLAEAIHKRVTDLMATKDSAEMLEAVGAPFDTYEITEEDAA